MLRPRERNLILILVVVALVAIYTPLLLQRNRSFMEDVGQTPKIPPWPEAHRGPVSEPAAATPSLAPAQVAAWVVQVGSFSDKANAEALETALQKQGLPAYRVEGEGPVQVLIGPYLRQSDAMAQAAKISPETANKPLLLPFKV